MTIEQELVESLEQRVKALEDYGNKLKNIVYVVTAVAVIFGVAGGLGGWIIKESYQEIAKLRAQLELVKEDAKTFFSGIREKQEVQFELFTQGKTEEFNDYSSTKKNELQVLIDIVEPRLTKIEQNIASNKNTTTELSQYMRKNYVHWGNQIQLKNNAYDRCLDLNSGNRNQVQTIGCKGGRVKEQTWAVLKR